MTYINHPYLKVLQDTLKAHKTLLECLEKRMTLIHIDYATKNEYEKNEIEITKIKTKTEIDAVKGVIKKREEYFDIFMKQFVLDAEDMEKNYDSILEKVKSNQNKITGAKDLLYAVNWKAVEENIEVKIALYKRLKDLIK
jgi:hypothetical protein